MKSKKCLIVFLLILTSISAVFMLCIKLRQPAVKVSLAGDLFLTRGMQDKIKEYGMDYPYQKVRKVFLDSDISFANLECPLTKSNKSTIKSKKYIFKEDPLNAFAIKRAGINVLGIANNHTMDYGPQGLIDTMNALNDAGILYTGGGVSKEEAHKPIFINKSGIRIGFLSYSEFPPEGYFNFDHKPDVSFLDNENLEIEIKEAKNKCDWLIVSFHWGREFVKTSSSSQKATAHQAIDSGADFVVGHHPHVLQEVEKYKGRLIFYSLGNLTFDKTEPEGVDKSVIISLKLTKHRINDYKMIPIEIVDCQARLLSK
jgi:poly-gamma-glutamate synthesis protein (capsule biosynthesis protein)